MAAAQQLMQQLPGYVSRFRETRLSALRPVHEFFDLQRLSRPQDLNEATSRISHNTRHFGGNYGVVVAALAVYALITNPLLLIALSFLIGGFAAINKFAPDPTSSDSPVTQKNLYVGLFVIGLPLLWFAAPLTTVFWIVGSSAVLVLGHASIMEPSVESEYSGVQAV